jgi:hypothetical protein
MDPARSAPPKPASAQVLARFVLRLLIIGVFATFSAQGFGKTAQSLFGLAMIYCAVLGGMRREAPFGPVLTNFDEAAAYGLCVGLARWAS